MSEEELSAQIKDASVSSEVCDFCSLTPAAPFDVLVESFMVGVDNEYRQADDEGIPWDHGYQGAKVIDTWDLVHDVYGDVADDERVKEELRGCIEELPWAVKDGWALPRDEEMKDAWEQFVHAVKYRTRFVYWRNQRRADRGEMFAPGDILDSIEDALIDLGLVKEIGSGIQIWRARPVEKGARQWRSPELGTPPIGIGKANRFSPDGISYFYGSESSSTALAELAGYSSAARAIAGKFHYVGKGAFVDLMSLPAVPSVFNARIGHLRRDVIFLQHFVSEMSKPRAAQGDMDYVPTQVVAEFLLRGKQRSTENVGLRYVSATDQETACWVLDVPNGACVEIGSMDSTFTRRLELVSEPRSFRIPHRRGGALRWARPALAAIVASYGVARIYWNVRGLPRRSRHDV